LHCCLYNKCDTDTCMLWRLGGEGIREPLLSERKPLLDYAWIIGFKVGRRAVGAGKGDFRYDVRPVIKVVTIFCVVSAVG